MVTFYYEATGIKQLRIMNYELKIRPKTILLSRGRGIKGEGRNI